MLPTDGIGVAVTAGFLRAKPIAAPPTTRRRESITNASIVAGIFFVKVGTGFFVTVFGPGDGRQHEEDD